MVCSAKSARVYDAGKGSDRYTIFLCNNVYVASTKKIIGKLGTTKDIQPCSCLGKRIDFATLPKPVQHAVVKKVGE